MKRGDVDWQEFAKQMLWQNIVSHKNEDSLYDISETGEIGHFRILSNPYQMHKPLTWKELALALGLFEEYLIHDGHDCKVCELRDRCHAYFKDDDDHEVCFQWGKLHKGKED